MKNTGWGVGGGIGIGIGSLLGFMCRGSNSIPRPGPPEQQRRAPGAARGGEKRRELPGAADEGRGSAFGFVSWFVGGLVGGRVG